MPSRDCAVQNSIGPVMKVYDIDGKCVEYEGVPDMSAVLAEFHKPACHTVLFVEGGDNEPLESLDACTNESTVFLVYESIAHRQHCSWVRERFEPLEYIFGAGEMLTWPKLEWKDRFLGSTDYIDGVSVSDLENHPAMLGEDIYGRAFVALRVIVGDTPQCVVIFQRYTDSIGTWAFAGHHVPISGSLHSHNVAYLQELLGKSQSTPETEFPTQA